jgi:Asp-tRNA(Asn)/Glu-tRNA(Gln) amidotransferase A subunit family amidase
MMTELYHLTASEALTLMQKGDITVEAYAKQLLSRVAARDEVVKAWVYLDPEYVLAQARTLDQIPADKRGPLHGVAVGVKDVIQTKGSPSELHCLIHVIDIKQTCQQPTILQSTKTNQQEV